VAIATLFDADFNGCVELFFLRHILSFFKMYLVITLSSKFTIKQIFHDHWDDFLNNYPNVRSVVIDEVEKSMECGNPAKGYALYFCEHCFKFKHVPFRCKSRFCNTCGTSYQMDRSFSISSKLINCKHRHIVFTIPEELRIFFRKDRDLLNILFKASAQVMLDWFFAQNKSQNFIPGIVSSLHTFGRDLKWNPHIHMLVTEGGSGNFSVWRHVKHFPFVMLRKKWQTTLLFYMEEALGKSQFRNLKNKLYSAHPEGFYVHAPSSDFNSPNTVANYITRYIGRPAMAQSRIIHYDGSFVTFWYQRHEDNKRIEETLHAHDFIKRLIIHIPQKHFHMLRYYGLYARNHKFQDKFIRLLSSSQVKARRFFKRWAFRIEQSFGFDPTKCSCGNYMNFLYIYIPSSIASSPP
jgi:hypothetical protein